MPTSPSSPENPAPPAALPVINFEDNEICRLLIEGNVPDGSIQAGLIKATCFGMILGTVACYKGFYTKGGAAGVGRATTSAVVVASVAILVSNYFIAVTLP